MAEAITKKDAEANLVIAKEALKKAQKEKKPTEDIKKLQKHVKNAEAVLNKVNKTLGK